MSLNVSQKNAKLCQTPDSEIFAKVITGLKPLKYFGKKFCVLMFDGVL